MLHKLQTQGGGCQRCRMKIMDGVRVIDRRISNDEPLASRTENAEKR